jgi:L-seryl-tRNA(Ser) seleniumtransferase
VTDFRRSIPAVNTLLAEAEREGLLDVAPRQLVLECIRTTLDRAREDPAGAFSGDWLTAVRQELQLKMRPSLIGVINATGVVIHTNLGRSPLATAASSSMAAAYRYNTLEYDLDRGERGSRRDHTRELLRGVTGAQDAIVVTNAAAAVLLVLNTLADGAETVVSRGELVEIGGAFRIPDIMAKSGSILVEVGTTNRTRIRDYELAISPRTRLLLKVHQSNFRTVGFVEETTLADLVALGNPRGIPTVHDVGSGLLLDLSEWGLVGEPRVQDSVAAGATVVFSGDKLMGGPQAGIIVGPTEIVDRLARNPLARAVRPDKMIIGALEATLALHRDPKAAVTEIPTLAMLTTSRDLLKRRAEHLANQIPGSTVRPGCSTVGGGAFPGAELATSLVCVTVGSADEILMALRKHDPPVVARAGDGAVLFDARTLRDDEVPVVAAAVRRAIGK